jgi:hypothetical protein
VTLGVEGKKERRPSSTDSWAKVLTRGALGGGGTGNRRRWQYSAPWTEDRRRPRKIGHYWAQRPTGLTATAEIKRIMRWAAKVSRPKRTID